MEQTLDEYTKRFYLLLEQYKKNNTLRLLNPSNVEYENLYNYNINNLNKLFMDIHVFDNKIQNNFNELDQQFRTDYNQVKIDRDIIHDLKRKESHIKDSYNASIPLKQEYKQRKQQKFMILCGKIGELILILGVMAFIVKKYGN
uniref:Uncharacterized protein n=1 Tax=viral metagenome TaxID=1070528 RepID=A0A6C0KHZ1_9ZZZZ